MKNATPKLRKKSFTIVEQACHEIHGFNKLYQELQDKVVLSGQTTSTLNSYARKLPQHIGEREKKLPVVLNRSVDEAGVKFTYRDITVCCQPVKDLN